jgi:hypothetical protein
MYVLIGQRFRVGAVECFGQRRCEPCAHLERLTHAWSLRFHPLDPLRPPLRRLERLSEVPTVSPHLPVAQLTDYHHDEYPSVAVVYYRLYNPQSLLDQHPAQLERPRRDG